MSGRAMRESDSEGRIQRVMRENNDRDTHKERESSERVVRENSERVKLLRLLQSGRANKW